MDVNKAMKSIMGGAILKNHEKKIWVVIDLICQIWHALSSETTRNSETPDSCFISYFI